MENTISAFWWGIISAVSLPLGAVLGLWLKPKQKLSSTLMAFGAGALLFALTIEIFGHVPGHVEEYGIISYFFVATGAVSGSILFDLLNQLLNRRGAFMRRLSGAKKYIARIKIKRTEKLIKELSSIKVLNSIQPAHMGEIISHIKKVQYRKGDIIFKQGDEAYDMFFIVDGKVEITYHDENAKDKRLAVLGQYDTFGELGILNDFPRTADVRALTDVRVFKIQKFDLKAILEHSIELQRDLKLLAEERIDELAIKTDHAYRKNWEKNTMDYLEGMTHSVSPVEVEEEGRASVKTKTGAALAIWLGIFIDGIPESLVIGMLSQGTKGMSLAFIAGVFLANLPEAMSSAVSMRKNKMSIIKIMLMWSSICIFTGIGAHAGSIFFPSGIGEGGAFHLILFIEGLAAGAMLTMIAETMMPEAFEQGGAIVGISTLAGFLAALYVKIM